MDGAWDVALRFLTITLIDLALSGDNAIVIGMAAASLPGIQRRWAILGGGALAILVRTGLTAIATVLLTIPLLSAVGGCVLFWVAWRLLALDTGWAADSETGPSAGNLRQAIQLIVIADVSMSADNVIAVAGSAHGNVALLVAGLLISMPLLMGTGGLVSMLIDRFGWLVYLGAVAISVTGGRMFLEDPLVHAQTGFGTLINLGISLAIGVAIPAGFVAIRRRHRA